MTDQFPAALERMLRNFELRLQRLESAQRVKPGLQIDFPEVPAITVPVARPTYPASFSSPATVSGTVLPEHYNSLRADIVAQTFTPLRTVILAGDSIGLWT